MEKDQNTLETHSETSFNNDDMQAQELQNVEEGIRNDSPMVIEHSAIDGKSSLFNLCRTTSSTTRR